MAMAAALVRGTLGRTACAWGLWPDEIRRMDGAFRYLKRQGLSCFWAVLGDDLLDLGEPEAREVVREFTSRLTREQKREDLPQSWVRVWVLQAGCTRT
jgi:hypothetical protein